MIGFLGLKGRDGLDDLDIPTLKALLQRVAGHHRPASWESTGMSQHQYRFDYRATHLDADYDMTRLEQLYKMAMKPVSGIPRSFVSSPDSPSQDRFNIDIEAARPWHDAIYESLQANIPHGVANEAYTIIVINPRKNAMAPGGQPTRDYNYRYVYADGTPCTSYIAHDRYVVVDLAAGPVEFGNVDVGEGFVTPHSFPRYEPMLKGRPETAPPTAAEFRAHLATVIGDLCKNIFATDVLYNNMYYSEKTLVPIIVLRNHVLFNPFEREDAGEAFIDVEMIQSTLDAMALTRQSYTVVPGVHSIHDHPHIAMAIAKARRASTVHEMGPTGKFRINQQPYIDALSVVSELTHSSDMLTAGLIAHDDDMVAAFRNADLPVLDVPSDDKSGGSAFKFKDPQAAAAGPSMGTRIVPVFVLSLLGEDPQLMIDGSELFAASHDAVVVLQTNRTNIPLPYFSDGKRMYANSADVNRPILAGLLSALGGVVPPHQRWSNPHGRVITDFRWATGATPFGPFASGNDVSALIRDQVGRNAIISRMYGAAELVHEGIETVARELAPFLRDPFDKDIAHAPLGADLDWIETMYFMAEGGTFWASSGDNFGALPLARTSLKSFHQELKRIQAQFLLVASYIEHRQLDDAYALSNSILVWSNALRHHALDQVEVIHKAMHCCEVGAVIDEPEGSIYLEVAFLAVVAVVAYVMTMFIVTTGKNLAESYQR